MKSLLSLIITMRYVAVRSFRKPGFHGHPGGSPNRLGEDLSEHDRQLLQQITEEQFATVRETRNPLYLPCPRETKHNASSRLFFRITVAPKSSSSLQHTHHGLDELPLPIQLVVHSTARSD